MILSRPKLFSFKGDIQIEQHNMKWKTLGILSFLLVSYSQLFAQIDKEKVHWIGYACGYGMQPTEAVEKVGQIIENKDFVQLIPLLKSGNPAEQYLSAITMLYLDQKETIQLKEEELKWIDALKKSTAYIGICLGCTENNYRMTLELFEGNYYEEAVNWINRSLDGNKGFE